VQIGREGRRGVEEGYEIQELPGFPSIPFLSLGTIGEYLIRKLRSQQARDCGFQEARFCGGGLGGEEFLSRVSEFRFQSFQKSSLER
jgi:hypothetical protein